MANLKELRNRISSVKATQKITKAMQMVAAAKLRRAQDAAEAGRPYAERMESVLANVGARIAGQDGVSPLLAGTGSDQTHLLVVATAERGLCGGFNSNIAKLARADALNLKEQGKTVKLMFVGRKGYDVLKREFESDTVERIEFADVKSIGFAQAEEVSDKIFDMFEDGAFDICTLYFSEFKSVISQIPQGLQLIPAKIPESTDDAEEGGSAAIYEYEPDEEAILNDLLPRNVTTQIFRGLLENAASEQGARMSAMDNATRNAGEMIDRLTILYNRSRQAQITTELIEIIAGAEAV